MLKSFRRIRTDKEDVKQLQDAAASSFQTILSKEILDGRLIEDVALATGSVQSIDHKLDRELKGYIVVKQSANVTLWDSQGSNDLSARTLHLNVSGDVTISLWVF